MIVQCNKCLAKFNLPESQLQGEGAWLRCGKCEDIFFLANPDAHGAAIDKNMPAGSEVHPEIKKETEILWEDEQIEIDDFKDDTPEDFEGYPAKKESGKKRIVRTVLLSLGGLLALFILSSYIFYIVNPEAARKIIQEASPLIPFSKEMGIEKKSPPAAAIGIDFVDVRKISVKNWVLGDMIVIQGLAVNKTNQPVSLLKIRARLLDQAGQFIGASSSYAGNILNEEELINLTEQEIRNKLSISTGNEHPNRDIMPESNIPFLIVFISPPPKASDEFIVELESFDRPNTH